MTEHEDDRHAGLLHVHHALADEEGADAFALHPWVDAHRAEAGGAEFAEYAERIKQDVADDLAVVFGDQLEQYFAELGAGGGSGINGDGLINSVIRNNLLYDNHASGISLYRIDGATGATD
mgnify:CR=1 FL=1